MKTIEVRLELTEEEAVLLLGLVKERAMDAEAYRPFLPFRNPHLPTTWSILARRVAQAVAEATGRNGT